MSPWPKRKLKKKRKKEFLSVAKKEEKNRTIRSNCVRQRCHSILLAFLFRIHLNEVTSSNLASPQIKSCAKNIDFQSGISVEIRLKDDMEHHTIYKTSKSPTDQVAVQNTFQILILDGDGS